MVLCRNLSADNAKLVEDAQVMRPNLLQRTMARTSWGDVLLKAGLRQATSLLA